MTKHTGDEAKPEHQVGPDLGLKGCDGVLGLDLVSGLTAGSLTQLLNFSVQSVRILGGAPASALCLCQAGCQAVLLLHHNFQVPHRLLHTAAVPSYKC